MKRINRAYKKVKALFLTNSTPSTKIILQRMMKQARNIKYAMKERNWNNYTQSINHGTFLAEIAKKVNIISGKTTKVSRCHDSTGKANELIDK